MKPEDESLCDRLPEAERSFGKFLNQHFRRSGPWPIACIPAQQTDDDLVVSRFMRECVDRIKTLSAEVDALNASKDFHRNMGITLLEAKYLDPNCHQGCKSLVWQQKLATAEQERDAAKFQALERKFKAGFFIAGDRDGQTTYMRYEGRSLSEIANQIIAEERGVDKARAEGNGGAS